MIRTYVGVIFAAAALSVVLASSVFAADAARFEAETMSESSTPIAPYNDNGTQVLRLTGPNDFATKSVDLTHDAEQLEVRMRATPQDGYYPTMLFYIDGTGSSGHVFTKIPTGTYQTYTVAVNVPAGNHTVRVRCLDASTTAITTDRSCTSTRTGLVDQIALTYSEQDSDSDGVPDSEDNCPNHANAGQADLDSDGQGDACDSQDNRDSDGDGTQNYQDNCPSVANPVQDDDDSDGIGDACDDDRDGDGRPNDTDYDPDDPNVQDPPNNGVVRTVGQGKQHATIQSCLNTVQPGETCLVDPGTYAPAQFVRGGNTTAGPITLKAVNPVWDCPAYDPVTNPETGSCTRTTTGISTISGSGNCLNLTASGLTNIRIEGFDFRCSGSGVDIRPSSPTADNIEIAFSHFQGSSGSAELSINRFEDDDGNGRGVDAHHLSFYEPNADGTGGVYTDYAVQVYLGSKANVHNIWCGNAYNHCISLKRYVRDTTIKYVHVEGSYDGVYIGQNADDPNTFNGPLCTTDRDSTCGNITVNYLFVRGSSDPNSDRPTPAQPLRVHNAYNVVAQNVFIAHATRGVYAAKDPTARLSKENGLCQAKGEDLTIGCGLFVSPQADTFVLHTKGIGNDTVTLKNFVSYAPSTRHFTFRNSDDHSAYPASCTRQETCQHPNTNWQNGIFVNGPALASGEIAARTTEQNNNYFGLTSRNQTGDTNLSPQFAGPTSVPRGNGVPTLDWSQIRTWAKGFYTTNVTLIAQNKGINACFK